jgi:hypothetical protein
VGPGRTSVGELSTDDVVRVTALGIVELTDGLRPQTLDDLGDGIPEGQLFGREADIHRLTLPKSMPDSKDPRPPVPTPPHAAIDDAVRAPLSARRGGPA